MSKYWPDGIELTDAQSPIEILHVAKSEWSTNSGGLLDLILQEAQSKSGNDMVVVHAKHIPSSRTASLFSVVCRKGQPYPATLQPKEDDLPNIFKKSRKVSRGLIAPSKEEMVSNPWVADTPIEFRKKLEEVFNLGIVKSEVFNLISSEVDRSSDGHSVEETADTN